MDVTKPPSKTFSPILALSLGILFVSTASIFIRFAQGEASSLVIAGIRLLIAAVILIPIALVKYRNEFAVLTKKDLRKAALSGLFLALHFASWTTSLEYTSVASSVVLVTTTPLWVAILSPIILKEPIRKSVLIGLVISISGGVVVGLGHACSFAEGRLVCQLGTLGGRVMLGNFLALFGAWMAAGYMLMGRQLRKKLDTVPYISLVYGVAALILVIFMLIQGEPIWGYSRGTYLWLMALGIFPMLLGHSLFNWALKYISAAYVSLMLLGEPIGTMLLAYFFLKESPTALEGVGAVLILGGIIIGSLGRNRRPNGALPALPSH